MKYENWSAGYWLLKKYIIFADRLVHKKIIVTGKDKIPANKPIVFAPNHQNALSDPLAILLNTRFQPVWLARADIFGKSKVIDTILKFLKIMPVYRLRDGKENLEKNEKTFADSIKVLENNFALALFPEAAHSFKRQMLTHKKAVPRIAFMAEEKTGFKLDIQIIPTGIYYSHYWKFDRTLIVNFGDPIAVSDYAEAYQKNRNDAVNSLKTRIYKEALPLTININSKTHYDEFELIRRFYGKHFLNRQNLKYSSLSLFKSDQKLVNELDNLELSKPDEAAKLAGIAKDYSETLKELKLKNRLITNNKNHFSKILANLLLLTAGLPLFIYGFIFNAIPFFIIDTTVRKKVKDKSFWSTFFFAPGLILFPVFYLLQLFAFSWLIPGLWLKLLFLISLPFTGKIAFRWYILLRKTIGRYRCLNLKLNQKNLYRDIISKKEELFNSLDRLIPL